MNSPYKVFPTPFDKNFDIPSSKSFANRALILASISKQPITVQNIPTSSDVSTMLKCLKQVGLEIEEKGRDVTVLNSFPECEIDINNMLTLETGDGGTTNRFLLSFLARGRKKYILIPSEHLLNRPIEELITVLSGLGAKVEKNTDSIAIEGPLSIDMNPISINSKRSTQFASGLALALADTNAELATEGMSNSKQYYELTKSLVEQFKKGETVFTTPPDFSSISYPIALACINGQFRASNCKKIDSSQPDSKLLEIIAQMGGGHTISKNGLEINGPFSLGPIRLNCSDFPDLVPTIVFLCSYADGISHLSGLESLEHKESNRINEILKLLNLFEINFRYNEKNKKLKITGKTKKILPVEYHAPNDHRLIMVAYLFMRMNSGGQIYNHHHVKKSFPRFFELMK